MADSIPAQGDLQLLARLHDVAGHVAGRFTVAVVNLESEPHVKLALIRASA